MKKVFFLSLLFLLISNFVYSADNPITSLNVEVSCGFNPPQGKVEIVKVSVALTDGTTHQLTNRDELRDGKAFEVIDDELFITNNQKAKVKLGTYPGISALCASNPKGLDHRYIKRYYPNLHFVPEVNVTASARPSRGCSIVDGFWIGFVGEKVMHAVSGDPNYGETRYHFKVKNKFKFYSLDGKFLSEVSQISESYSFYNNRAECNKARSAY